MQQKSGLGLWSAIAYGAWCAIATLADLTPADRLPQDDRTATVRVTRVASGQTIEVELDGNIETVRLSGLDAPDLRQTPWGQESQQALARVVEGQMVTLSWSGTGAMPPRDRFDRLRAHVWQGDRLVAADRVRAGTGLASSGDRAAPYATELSEAQLEARVLERGIWSPGRAMRRSPSEFRSEL